MLRLRERLRKLERSQMLRRIPDLADPAVDLALRQISDEELVLLTRVVRDQEAGICRPPSPTESVAIAAYETALANVRDGV
jgi:hypothetical protein